MVTATLLDGADVFDALTSDGINGTNDASMTNTGELATGGNYAGCVAHRGLILGNFEGGGTSGTGLSDFTPARPVLSFAEGQLLTN